MASLTVSGEGTLLDLIPKKDFDALVADKSEEIKKKNHLGGLAYWLILGLCVGKDIFDILWELIFVAGLSLSATVVGALLGLPLIVFAKLAGLFCGLTMSIIVMVYLSMSDSTFGIKLAAGIILRRLLIPVVIVLLDSVIPGLEALPITTLVFMFTVFLENRIRKGGVLGAATKLIVKELSSTKVSFHHRHNIRKFG